MWIGYSPDVRENTRTTVGGINIQQLAIPDEPYQAYYNGFHNQCLYPLFHELMGEYVFEQSWLNSYLEVNEIFARAVLDEIKSPDDVIWVHDAHLLPLAYLLRTQDVANPIGYFSHIPFPSQRILRCFPAQHDLSAWLDSYDQVGFQTEEDAEGYPAGKCYPIGIDYESVPVSTEARHLSHRSIIGIDRLDYSKGILQRFEGFDRFMRKLNFDASVNYWQISPPTRMSCPQYAGYSSRVMQRATQLKAHYPAKFTFQPEGVSHPVALKALGNADVALVTPLRDGMNLVAHEFVAAQNPADPGVLVLSKTSGSAATLSGAILIDPYDADSIAEGIYAAVTMQSDQRRELHRANLEAVKAQNVFSWWNRFLADLVKSTV